MGSNAAFVLAFFQLLIVPLACVPVRAQSQSAKLVLTRQEEAELDSLTSGVAERIRKANLDVKEPTVIVVDFFRGSSGNSSQLGTLFADRFSESLAAYSGGFKILDRKSLRDYLTENWTTLEDLQSNDVCWRIGRQLGAMGVILGTLYEENGQISLTIHLEGFGPDATEGDPFKFKDERARFPSSEERKVMLYERGPNYARTAEEIPPEPGVFKAGIEGVSSPVCVHCVPASYSDAARAAKYHGTVVLSVVVTTGGQATSTYVVKGAPFGLTTQAIEAIRKWQFKPGQKDGMPVPVRVPIETTFSLN